MRREHRFAGWYFSVVFATLVLGIPLLSASEPVHQRGSRDADYFTPQQRLPGIGAGRTGLSDDVIQRRTRRMIQAQTFAILRDPRAVTGARRIYGRRLQRIFDRAAAASGLPSSLVAAIAYLESWGNARAQSPSGPRGIMQIAKGTARAMGLQVVYARRYRVRTSKHRVKTRHGKWITKRVRVRVYYSVLIRDDRLVPARAVPAAAKYLARLEKKFGRLDWAVFAYHCGESCAARMLNLTRQAAGIAPPFTVPKMFFAANPALNRELYLAIKRQMERDYSPTYWFRVMRARDLLAAYRKDPPGFSKLATEFRYATDPSRRAPNRLAVWMTGDEVVTNCKDIAGEGDRDPMQAFDDAQYFGFRIRTDSEAPNHCLVASPSTIGTVVYIAFETRQLYNAMGTGEPFVPLTVTFPGKVQGRTVAASAVGERADLDEAALQASGRVFDVTYGKLPPGEREAFEFALNDLGWGGYLGFIHSASARHTLHIGCSPSSRDFFREVFEEAARKPQERAGGTAATDGPA